MHTDNGIIAVIGKAMWDNLNEQGKNRLRKLFSKRLANASQYSQFKEKMHATYR